MGVGHTRAWARGRRSGPISTICRRRWQHDNATGAVALLQSGCGLPARGHGHGETYLSTGGKTTYRDRNAVAGNRATSERARVCVGLPDEAVDRLLERHQGVEHSTL